MTTAENLFLDYSNAPVEYKINLVNLANEISIQFNSTNNPEIFTLVFKDDSKLDTNGTELFQVNNL